MLQEPGRALDLAGANRYGQQLFFANMHFHRRRTKRLQPPPWHTRRNPPIFLPDWEQQPLFHAEPDPEMAKARALAATGDLVDYCGQIVDTHSAQRGWSKRQRNDVIRSLRLLQSLQPTPGAKIRATDVLQLPRYGGNVISTLDVLAAAGQLIDDRPSNVETYFAGKTKDLPQTMRSQLETWLEVMLHGSTTAPRQSRDPLTARIHILGIAPIINTWAAAGHQSLAEITPEQVRAALPERGSARNWAEYGLRSLFKTLKRRKLIFADPTRGMNVTPVNATVPLPMDTAAIREALNSPDPAIAAAVALVAFHALTSQQLRQLKLTNIIDGRLTLAERIIPLAAPVRVRLGAWLDHRARTWPGSSANPHLFVSRRTAPRLIPVGGQFPWRKTNLKPQALREDRILADIHASGGDVRICDLFGITVQAALRYADTLSHPDLTKPQHRVPRTRTGK